LYGIGGSGTTNGVNGTGTEGNPLITIIPKRTNHGGGAGGDKGADYLNTPGIACCIIEFGESMWSY
jgi:hypothetical protein